MTETKIQIIEGLRQRSPKSQREAFELFGSNVWAQVVRIVSRQEDAEEIYQDVFVKAFRHIESYDERKSSLSSWLMRIAYHEALNYMRGRNIRKITIEDCMPEAVDISNEEVNGFFGKTDDETIGLIEQALERLPSYERSLISMYYYEELSVKEIAYVTDSVPATVATKLFRIRQKLYHIILEIKNE